MLASARAAQQERIDPGGANVRQQQGGPMLVAAELVSVAEAAATGIESTCIGEVSGRGQGDALREGVALKLV
eukprot:10538574-Alexandrium_andersonii.AAC.1